MKTLKDILVRDNELSGSLTPENGESYNPALGEPKFHTAYKASAADLRKFAKAQIKYLRKQEKLHWEWIKNYSMGEHSTCDMPKGFDRANGCSLPHGYETVIRWIQTAFNLKVDKNDGIQEM